MMSILLQNLLRNAAKSGCQTNYTYIPDIDMVPTPSMDLQLEQFLSTPEVHFLLTTVDLQCLPMSQGEGKKYTCMSPVLNTTNIVPKSCFLNVN